MHDKLDPTPEFQALVEQLGVRDMNAARAAQTALASRGEAGIAAAIWGLSHPNVRVRGDVRALWIITAPLHLFGEWPSILRVARSASHAP